MYSISVVRFNVSPSHYSVFAAASGMKTRLRASGLGTAEPLSRSLRTLRHWEMQI